MNRGQCRDYLQKLLESGVKFGLDNVRAVLAALDEPHRSYPSVLVGGTNGKGSVSAMLAEILTRHGLRVGLYTSPHLVRVEERVRVGGEEISGRSFSRRLTAVKETAEALVRDGKLAAPPTYFETLTCLALLHFREESVDAAVLEVGLGGRLDATNAVEPLVSVITTVSRDHREYLGDTLAGIAFEKAGIVKPGVPVVSGVAGGVARDVIRKRAREVSAPLVEVFEGQAAFEVEKTAHGCRFRLRWRGRDFRFSPRLPGAHQGRNAAVALVAALSLKGPWGTPKRSTVLEGISRAVWPGRLETVGRRPRAVLDGAHNEEGARALAAYAADFLPRPLTLVFAAMRDKDIGRLARILFPLAGTVILTGLPMPRAARPEDVLRLAPPTPRAILVEPDPARAWRMAREITPGSGSILAAGSLFLIGELKKRIDF
jgi:dihydrofolate synthase/folylpolyglutamate synthase